MRLILVVIALLAVRVPVVGAALVTDDPVFSQTVTVDLKGEALSDVCRVLSNAAGVRIRPAKDVEDQKVTIVVDKMPLRDVMNGLATLFGWEWMVQTEDDHNIYTIYDPLKKKREADRKEAIDKAWKALGVKLDSLPGSAEGGAGFYKALALQQYKSLSPELRKEYLSGMRLCYSLESSTTAWQPSQSVMNEFASADNRMKQPTYKGNGDWAAWEPDSTKPDTVTIELYSVMDANVIAARCNVAVGYTHPDSRKGGTSMGLYSSVAGDSAAAGVSGREGGLDLCDQKIDYPAEALENALPDNPADGLLSKKVSISVAELVADVAFLQDGSGPCYTTRTDLLAALHNKLGVQIIADYYSSWDSFTDLQDITAKQFVEEKLPGFPTRWGWDGSVLYSRVKDVRTADAKEVPNRFLRPWQAMVKKQGFRGLEELTQAAAFLSGEQRQAMSENCHYLKLGDCKEIDNIGGRESALLRFYGLLTPKQKKDIFAGQVGVIGLTTEQRSALAALIYTTNPTHVGVYNNDGLNVNEPQAIRGYSGALATSVTMTCNGSFIYLKSGDDLDSRVIKLTIATTPEEALAMARNQLGKDVDPQNVVATGDTIYSMTVNYEGFTGITNEPVPEFSGSMGASPHSTYHRVKIKVPEKKR